MESSANPPVAQPPPETGGAETYQRDKFDYLLKQLDLAHRRNDLVDQLRYKVFQIFFTFHGLLIAAAVLGDPAPDQVQARLGYMRFGLPVLAFFVGWFLFALFLRWHSYLYRYKAWIKAVEGILIEAVYPGKTNLAPPGHTGSYYLDENAPQEWAT